MADDLPIGYYLDNFEYLLDFVQSRYADLLTATEQGFYRDFKACSLDARRLYVRLTSRKGPYVRSDKLKYSELVCQQSALSELVDGKLVRYHDESSAGAWLQLSTRTELLSCFSVGRTSGRKHEIAEEVQSAYVVRDIETRLPFDLLSPCYLEVLRVFQLLFFGNLYQGLTEFVLRDLGIFTYETYPLDQTQRYFHDRASLEALLNAYDLQTAAAEVMADPNLDLCDFARAHLLELAPSDSLLAERYSKVLNRVARQLERQGATELALALYDKSILAPANERRARLLAADGQCEAALRICQEICDTTGCEAEFEFAVTFGRRLVKKHGLDATRLPDALADDYPVSCVTIPKVEGERVETCAAEWYRAAGDTVEYVENGLLPGLFGLCFWDIIFASKRGAFFNPFQRGPADLFSQGFYTARASDIELRLAELDNSDGLLERVRQCYEQKSGIANYFVMWRWLTPELIEQALARIPARDLTVIFRRMLQDLKSNRSGLPDLVVFPQDGGYELIEIKGPGDTLQHNQRRWMRFFARHDIPAQVVNVQWLEQ